MIRINIYDKYGKSFWRSSLFNWYPLWLNNSKLRKRKIEICYYSNFSEKIFDCDIVCLSSIHLRTKEIRANQLDFVKSVRDKAKKVIWFDFHDSSGCASFELLPYVDKYLKKQLLVNKDLYRQSHILDRYDAEYFYQKYKTKDSLWSQQQYEQLPRLEKKYEHKLGLNWNIGMYPIRGGATLSVPYLFSIISELSEKVFNTPHFLVKKNPISNRDIDMLALFGIGYRLQTIAFQRKMGIEIIKNKCKGNILCGPSRLSRNSYWKALRNSKIVLSLFGWGEICFREMEGFLSGAAILMPDMSHIETWPNYYIPNQTYVPIKWDLEDLAETYEKLISDNSWRENIAVKGFANYCSFWNDEGQNAFLNRFEHEINQIVSS